MKEQRRTQRMVRLPPDLYDELKRRALAHDLTVAQAVRRAVRGIHRRPGCCQMRRDEIAEYEKVNRLGYDLTDERDCWIYRCVPCGALVADRERHTEWHYEIIIELEILGRPAPEESAAH